MKALAARLALLILATAGTAFAQGQGNVNPSYNASFHPLVTTSGQFQGWWNLNANKPAQGTVADGKYEVRDNNGNVIGWITKVGSNYTFQAK